VPRSSSRCGGTRESGIKSTKYGIEQGVAEPETTDTDSVPDDAAATDGGIDE